MSYLAEISIRLAAGAAGFPEEFRRRQGGYLAAAGEDGGFCGRQGRGNAYYTGFALRALALLGRLDAETARRAAGFLRRQLGEKMSGVDFFSLVMSDKLLRDAAGVGVLEGEYPRRAGAVAAGIDRHRCGDGGFAKTSSASASSLYHTFLAIGCKQLYGIADSPPDDADGLFELVASRRRGDGGYVEIPQMRQSGTNPTAAAVAILKIIGRTEDDIGRQHARAAAAFFANMQNREGGFRANTRIPAADLLSTFTALAALDGLLNREEKRLVDVVDVHAARRYVNSLQDPGGGFRGGAWDDAVDVEYTFYGLGALALLNLEIG